MNERTKKDTYFRAYRSTFFTCIRMYKNTYTRAHYDPVRVEGYENVGRPINVSDMGI